MKKALLLHWWEGTNTGCWFPWLKEELENRWFEVFSPNLPNTEWPIFEEQIEAIWEFAKTMWEWDVIVWHSLGCCLATQCIEKYKMKNIQVVLVAPVYPKLSEEIKEMLGKYYDTLDAYYSVSNTFEKLDNQYTIFLSDNDPFITMESAKTYYNNFALQSNNSVEYKEFHNWYHFSDWAPDPIKQIPKILNYIK